MLKQIPAIISPDLMKTIMEMGHGDEIVFADGNFPAASRAQKLIRCDGHGIPELLDAVLKFFPLDSYTDTPVSLMKVVSGDDYDPVIWEDYRDIITRNEEKKQDFNFIERFDFYQKAEQSYAVVATGESALYANIILKKGVVKLPTN